MGGGRAAGGCAAATVVAAAGAPVGGRGARGDPAPAAAAGA